MFPFVASQYSDTPGVYIMKDGRGTIIYVGKAKSLRKRLSSYFVGPHRQASLTPKTRALVSRIARIDTLLTSTEKEALLLEESLIKKHKPRYNVVLRDDKQYVLFKLSRKHRYPRLTLTRKVVRDGSVYFGPFTSSVAARSTGRTIDRIFPLRKCTNHVFANRVRPCLYFDMRQCLAPCVRPVDPDEYNAVVRQVEMLLSGRSRELVDHLAQLMRAASEEMDYEQAARMRDRIRMIEKTVERQTVVLPGGTSLDALALTQVEDRLLLGMIFVREGRLIGHKTFSWPGMDLAEGHEVLASFLPQFYTGSRFIPPRILLPFELEGEEDAALAELLAERREGRLSLRGARGADEKKLLEMARANAKNDASRAEEVDMPALLQERLNLCRAAHRVECVDISHTGGQGMRAGQVVFEAGEPRKDAYRVYTMIESAGTGDDYAALAEYAHRRVESGPPWPDLLLIDGGRGQLSAVHRTLQALDILDTETGEVLDCFELASIAKASRKKGELGDVIFRPGRKNPLNLRPGSAELLFLQRVRDEAHRYVIGRQRKGRSAEVLTSDLLSLPGVGPKTARLLWDTYGSVAAMAKAGEDALAALPGIGKKRAAELAAGLRGLMDGGE